MVRKHENTAHKGGGGRGGEGGGRKKKLGSGVGYYDYSQSPGQSSPIFPLHCIGKKRGGGSYMYQIITNAITPPSSLSRHSRHHYRQSSSLVMKIAGTGMTISGAG